MREGRGAVAIFVCQLRRPLQLCHEGRIGRFGGVPAPILRGMENLKLALRLRMSGEPFNQSTVESIAAALDTAAHAVEQS